MHNSETPYYLFMLSRANGEGDYTIGRMLMVHGEENVPVNALYVRKFSPGDVVDMEDHSRIQAIFDPRDLAGTSHMTDFGFPTAGLRYQQVSGLSAFIWHFRNRNNKY